MVEINIIKGKVTTFGAERLHIEIPKIYHEDFKVGDIVLISKEEIEDE